MKPGRIVYLNNEFLPVEQAKVSVLDRGFLFGDGIYEVVPVFEGRLFLPHQHLTRLEKSAEGIQLALPFTVEEFLPICQQLLQHNAHQGDTQMVYIEVTRGAAPVREHTFPADVPPTVFAQCTPVKAASVAELSKGSSATTVQDIRWSWCYIKAITLLPNVMFAERAKAAGSREAIILRDGMALEGASSNLFIVEDGVIITPPVNHQILPGITRDLVLQLAAKHQVPYKEEAIPEVRLRHADEIWMTGSIKEILPVTYLDGEPVADGKVGPMWRKMIRWYQDCKTTLHNS